MENIQPKDQEQAEVTQVKFGQDESTQDQSGGQVDSTDYGTWDNDKRYSTHWGEDPNKMYQSLRYHEKKQGDFDNQINDYKTQVEALKEYETNYKAVEDLFNDPNIGPKLSQVINEYQAGNQQAQSYNPNGVTDPNQQAFYQQLQPIQQQLQEMSNWRNDLMNAVNQQNAQQVQDQQFEAIDQIASQHGLSYDKNSFIQEMNAKNIPVEYWSAHFNSVAMPQVLANATAQASTSALKNANETHSIAGQADKTAPSGEGQSFYDKLMAASYIPMS